MLEKLLKLVAEGGVHSYAELSESLAVPESLLEAMLQDLARFGYLRRVDNGCGRQCAGCSMGGCSVTGPERLWTLTDKGVSAAARLPSG